MQVKRKAAVAAIAAAALATIGLGTAVNAQVGDPSSSDSVGTEVSDNVSANKGDGTKWYWVQDGGGLVAVDDNNVGPFQLCNNHVPINVLGVQVPVDNIVGIVGLGNDGNTATAVKTCEQDSKQANDGPVKAHKAGKPEWYEMDDDGLLSISNNNVGPFQVCNNFIPINVLAVQVPLDNLNAILGLGNDKNATESLKSCEQENKQHN
jgi:hypothetical protein